VGMDREPPVGSMVMSLPIGSTYSFGLTCTLCAHFSCKSLF